MDEAHLLGKGRYFHEHGYVPSGEIIKRHLEKICDIAKPYGYELLLWSDMFIRSWNDGKYYIKDEVKEVPEEVVKALPNGVIPVYWDYYSEKESEYDCMIKIHKQLSKDSWFARGISSWTGFTPNNLLSMKTDIPNYLTPNAPVKRENPSKNLLYSDPFLGFMDYTVPEGANEIYARHTAVLYEISKETRKYGYVFSTLAALCDSLSIKAELGIKTRAAYKNGDKAELLRLANGRIVTANQFTHEM